MKKETPSKSKGVRLPNEMWEDVENYKGELDRNSFIKVSIQEKISKIKKQK